MENRIEEILDFFKAEGIVDEGLTVDFDEDEDTCFLISDMSININYAQIVEEDGKEAEFITCGYDKKLLGEFATDEIAFFHELGHFCDLKYRLDFRADNLIKENAELQSIMFHADRIRIKYLSTFLETIVESLALKLYRGLSIEKYADENARALMYYYLEHSK